MEFLIPKAGKVTVKRDGANIVLEMSTKVIPYDAALELARAIIIKAKQIEEDVKAGRIIADQALLIRLGIPIGLTNDPAKIKEAMKDSYWDPELRKYITGARAIGIESAEKIGTPSLIMHKPKEGGNHNV